MARFAWGIDIGDGTLKAVRLKSVGDGFEVVRAIEIPYFDPFIRGKKQASRRQPPSAAMDRRALAALVQFGNSVKIPDRDIVSVGFPSFKSVDGFIEPPRVSESKLSRIVDFEVAKIVSSSPDELDIRYNDLGSRSQDIYRIQTFSAPKQEIATFLRCLDESRLPCDRLISSAAAMAELMVPPLVPPGNYAVISPGLASTAILVVRRSSIWTRIVPSGLPLPPGESAHMARDRIAEFADRIQSELTALLSSTSERKPIKISRIFITGEGARVPSLINSLDSCLGLPVQLLRLEPLVAIDPQKYQLPPLETVDSMSKAIGLAVNALRNSHSLIVLNTQDRKRQLLRWLPVAASTAGLFLFAALGLTGTELWRGMKLNDIEKERQRLVSLDLTKEINAVEREVRIFQEELSYLGKTSRKTSDARIPGWIISRFESRSEQQIHNDYYLDSLNIEEGSEGRKELTAVVATRLNDRDKIEQEMTTLFEAVLKKVNLTGPHPSGEINPPTNESPLVHYEVKGPLQRIK